MCTTHGSGFSLGWYKLKLIIQIPCYNEEETLALALKELPRQVDGFEKVEWLIINDGSVDRTAEVARECGVDHIVNFRKNKGLARGFMAGVHRCLEEGADVIVNTDADNQYDARDIPKLVKPILEGKADIVVGERPISTTEHFSPQKKFLQKLGSWVVRVVSGTDIPDAPSGFRAFNREAALTMNVFNDYTYTIETIIQAGQADMAITSTPIRTNEDLRPSRLFKSMFAYIKKSVFTMIRIFMVYRPFKVFMGGGLFVAGLGFLFLLRFLIYFLLGDGDGHIQSVVFGGVLMVMGVQIISLAFIADLSAANRKLLEKVKMLTFLSYLENRNAKK